MAHRFSIVEQVYPPPLAMLRFRLIETIDTTDGPRSRICDGGFPTLERAQAEVQHLQKERAS